MGGRGESKTQAKLGNHNDKLSKKLPKKWQIEVWNTFFNVETTMLLNEARPKIFSKNVKAEMLRGYYAQCEVKKCYSCSKEREAEIAALEKKLNRENQGDFPALASYSQRE